MKTSFPSNLVKVRRGMTSWRLGQDPDSVTHPGAKWLSHLLTRPKWFPVVGPADQPGYCNLDGSLWGKMEKKGAEAVETPSAAPPF